MQHLLFFGSTPLEFKSVPVSGLVYMWHVCTCSSEWTCLVVHVPVSGSCTCFSEWTCLVVHMFQWVDLWLIFNGAWDCQLSMAPLYLKSSSYQREIEDTLTESPMHIGISSIFILLQHIIVIQKPIDYWLHPIPWTLIIIQSWWVVHATSTFISGEVCNEFYTPCKIMLS